ncbi:MAG: nickel-dependent hydrogenase large subunit, partial [Deltaproteobacteria bacterium]|nr:nickel-dependent hydrogenase large subunit [Deltaproteobacteria bacterium]
TASARAVDAVYGVVIPETADIIRRLQYNAFVAGDHTTHFFALGGPDFIVGPDAPPAERNVIGVIRKVGLELGQKVIRMRKEAHEVAEMLGGRRVNPVGMIPGGVSKAVTEEMRARLIEVGDYMLEFSKLTQQIFADVVLSEKRYVDLILSPAFAHETYYMSLVDDDDRVDHCGRWIRVVDPQGGEFARFEGSDYLEHITERVESWTYMKFPFLNAVGWCGFSEGRASGVYRVAPLGMLNAARGMKTPLAQAEHEKMYETLGGKPVHATLAYHWARIIEMLQCAELVVEHAHDERLTSDDIRTLERDTPTEGVGVVEAPRGVLIHHYWTDEKGIVEKANLIVGTTHNHAALNMSIKRAAEGLLTGGEPDESVLNMIEMSYRAYDPCFACATHSLPGQMALEVNVYGPDGRLERRLVRP